MNRRIVLMIAYHFPPAQGSSGIQRTLKFCQYLSDHGWDPVVLSAHPRAYASVHDGQLKEIPRRMPVTRAFALDTARHLAVGGAYSKLLALPDRWTSWWLGAVPAGLALVRRYRPRMIWSTYPIATAHMIGWTLARLTGIPWVADFRDSMTEDHYPADPLTHRAYRWIERNAVRRCHTAVFTTPGAARMYAARYPEQPHSKWRVIENGYDEENFREAAELSSPAKDPSSPLVLVHSGVLYPSERDPTAFFAALRELRDGGKIAPRSIKIVLRATGHDAHYARVLAEFGLGEMVELGGALPYREALAEMINADGLLLFQAANCNHQIPAKLYEYFRARRPILALTDPTGDTAGVLRRAGITTMAALDSKVEISNAMLEFISMLRAGKAPIANSAEVERNSRSARTRELAAVFDAIDGEVQAAEAKRPATR